MLNNLNSDVTKPNTSNPIDTDKIEERIEDVQQQVNDLKDEVDKEDIEKRKITAEGIVTENLITNTISSNTSTTDHIEAKTADIDNISTTHIDTASIDTLSVTNQIDELKVKDLQTDSLDTNSISTKDFISTSIDTPTLNADTITNKTITTESIFSDGGNFDGIETNRLYVQEVQGAEVNATQINAGIIETNNLTVTEQVQSEFANFIETTTEKLSTREVVLNNTINLDPELQTPGDWYAITIPDYSIAQIFLHYKWMEGDNTIAITKSGNTAFIQYDISNQNAIKSISWRREDGSIKIHIRADGELQYHITHLEEDVEREITSENNGDEYTDYIFTPTKLHTYLFKGFTFNDYSLEAPLLARFSILEADEEQFELLSTNVLAVNDAIRLPTDWDELGNVVGRSDGEDKQIIRMRTKNDVTKPTYEDPVDNEEVTPLEYDDKLTTQNTVANYDGTVLDEDGNNVYPITNLGNNTITHGGHEVVGDLNVRGEVTAHTIDVDKDVTIRGDLYVEGKTTTTVETQVATSGDYLVTRENNPTVLGENERSGIVINNYNTDGEGNSKAASITVNKDGVVGVSANTTINKTTYTDISFYNNKYYEGLTDVESSATLDIITDEVGDEKEDAVFYDGNYYYYTGEDWRGPIQYTDDKGLYGDVVEEPALESLDKHTLIYYKSVTTQSINPEDVQPLATRTDSMEDRYYPVWDNDNSTLTTDISNIQSIKVSDGINKTRVQTSDSGATFEVYRQRGSGYPSNTNSNESCITMYPGSENCIVMQGPEAVHNSICMCTPYCGQNKIASWNGVETTILNFPNASCTDKNMASDLCTVPFGPNLVQENGFPGGVCSMISNITYVDADILGITDDNDYCVPFCTFACCIMECNIPQGKIVFSRNGSCFTISGLCDLDDEKIESVYSEEANESFEWYGDVAGFRAGCDDISCVEFKYTNWTGNTAIYRGYRNDEDVYWDVRNGGVTIGSVSCPYSGYITITGSSGVCRSDVCLCQTGNGCGISIGTNNFYPPSAPTSCYRMNWGSALQAGYDSFAAGIENKMYGPISNTTDYANISRLSTAVGQNNCIYSGACQIALGRGNRICNTGTTSTQNVAIGTYNTLACAARSAVFGSDNEACCGYDMFVLGESNKICPAGTSSGSILCNLTLGCGNVVRTSVSVVAGFANVICGCTTTNMTGNVFIGMANCTNQPIGCTVMIGYRNCIDTTNTNGSWATVIGYCNCNPGNCTVNIGYCNCTSVPRSIAIGQGNIAAGTNAVTIGCGAYTKSACNIAIGFHTCACTPSSIAMGPGLQTLEYTYATGCQGAIQLAIAGGLSNPNSQCANNKWMKIIAGFRNCSSLAVIGTTIDRAFQSHFGSGTWLKGFGKTLTFCVTTGAVRNWDDRLILDWRVGYPSQSRMYLEGNWYYMSSGTAFAELERHNMEFTVFQTTNG